MTANPTAGRVRWNGEADHSKLLGPSAGFDGTWFHRNREDRSTRMNTARQLALQVLEAMNANALDRIGPLVSEDFIDHGAPPWAPTGRAGYLQTMGFVTGVLRVRYELHDVVAEGDRVAIRATAHGVHTTGHLGFAATGKPYAMPTMHLYRESGGVLVEHWGVRDELSVLWQVGALPVPGPVPLVPAGSLAE
jgi:predicted ester cyclase